MANIDQQCVNTIRCLSIDGVQAANSGHPGLPLGLAPAAYAVWKNHLRFFAANPTWINRDRFVLSAGHGSMLLYSLLHLFGYPMPIAELKNFRKLGSKTPGHPEYDLKLGIEVTTGPLGQGLANAVGMAIAAKYLQTHFNKADCELLDYNIYVLAGDGDMQEGVTAEACSLAGHLKLDNLIVIYDNNHISIDGQTNLSFSEQVAKRFEAYGFETNSVQGDGNDLNQIQNALTQLKKSAKPKFLALETIIGYGSPKFQNSAKAHGSPLGAAEVKQTKLALGQPADEDFYVANEVKQHFEDLQKQKQAGYETWQQKYAKYQTQYPEKAEELKNWQAGLLGAEWLKKLPQFETGDMATRTASGKVLDAIMPGLPQILAGSADLTPSNNTLFAGAENFAPSHFNGRYVRYGVREHAMAAILNGIAQSQLLRAYAGTFLCFADYMRPSIRLAALSGHPSIFVFTHDSIGLGEDGPTHQPIEHLASLRAIPNFLVLRPADANETQASWRYILENPQPCALILTRQNLPVLKPQPEVSKGAYLLVNTPDAECLLIASGSEVQFAIAAQKILAQQGVLASVVSFPSWELFEQQSAIYKQYVLPNTMQKRVVIEAGVCMGWEKYMGTQGKFIGMQGFGASAPHQQLYQHFGITTQAVVDAAVSLF